MNGRGPSFPTNRIARHHRQSGDPDKKPTYTMEINLRIDAKAHPRPQKITKTENPPNSGNLSAAEPGPLFLDPINIKITVPEKMPRHFKDRLEMRSPGVPCPPPYSRTPIIRVRKDGFFSLAGPFSVGRGRFRATYAQDRNRPTFRGEKRYAEHFPIPNRNQPASSNPRPKAEHATYR